MVVSVSVRPVIVPLVSCKPSTVSIYTVYVSVSSSGSSPDHLRVTNPASDADTVDPDAGDIILAG